MTISIRFLLMILCGILSKNAVAHRDILGYGEPCENGYGVCMTGGECAVNRGRNVGTCYRGSVCCKISKTCNEIITANNTFFVNPDNRLSGSSCSVEIKKKRIRDGICQIRLDMTEFNIVGPHTQSGKCIHDNFVVSGQQNVIPDICGLNSGQHMYIDVKQSADVQLTMNIGQNTTYRHWKIRVTQIPCKSERLAPHGCLQYFEKSSGYLTSFNYGNPTNESSYPLMQTYSMCFRDVCNLRLTKSGPFGLGSIAENRVVNDIRGLGGSEKKYIDFYCFDHTQPEWNRAKTFLGLDNARFCGGVFPSIYTTYNPVHEINLVFVKREEERDRNQSPTGFRLFYEQLCNRGKFSS